MTKFGKQLKEKKLNALEYEVIQRNNLNPNNLYKEDLKQDEIAQSILLKKLEKFRNNQRNYSLDARKVMYEDEISNLSKFE